MAQSSVIARVVAVLVVGFVTIAHADEEAETRAAMAKRLLDTNLADVPSTFAVFEEGCGSDCDFLGYGGCFSDQGVITCLAKIFDIAGDAPKQVVAATVRDGKQANKLAAARAQLVGKLGNVGSNPLWLEEHRFETPAKDITRHNLTFRWDWKRAELTVLDKKKVVRKVKAGALPKGLGLTSAAVWFNLFDGGGGAGHAVLRTVGEDDVGHAGDAVVLVAIPYADPNR